MAYILKVSGDEVLLEDTSLEKLQEAVEGYIEIIPTIDKKFMVVNEEGLLKGLLVNPEASRLANRRIVGNVVVCEIKELK